MGQLRPVQLVKPIIGIIASTQSALAQAESSVISAWGAIDDKSPCIPFSFSDYYNAEMGTNLLRRWLSLSQLISPDTLASMKHTANTIEDSFRGAGKRTVNIDPGYIALSKLVLASTKDFSHRVYVGNQIYEEITLLFRANKFIALPWSYADYQCDTAMQFLTNARERLKQQLEK
jgi:hypothetical protein